MLIKVQRGDVMEGLYECCWKLRTPESSHSGGGVEDNFSAIESIGHPVLWMVPAVTYVHCNLAWCSRKKKLVKRYKNCV